ncbi:hypothetical protein GQ600_21606 [Phytophthora cactorum]|nr:hypothetical protein GQ600_21606 [Phytophthora cactorum]
MAVKRNYPSNQRAGVGDIEWCIVLVLGAYCKAPSWTSEAKEDNIEDKNRGCLCVVAIVLLVTSVLAATMPLLFQTTHDYGGASYICSDGDNNANCSTRDELITALENKFKWQLEYTSPNDDRRVRKDHVHVYTIEDTDSGGDADIHACCQCYGYSDVAHGDDYCAGGNTDMYYSCIAKCTEWSDDSRMPMAEKVQTCNATREIVSNHYSSVVLPIGVLVVSVVAVTMLLLFQTTRRSYRHKAAVVLSFQYAMDESTKGAMKSSNANMDHPMNALESTKVMTDSTA